MCHKFGFFLTIVLVMLPNFAFAQVVISGPGLELGPGIQFGSDIKGLGKAKILGTVLCRPNDNQTPILGSRNPSDYHPNWRPPNSIGPGWSLKLDKVYDDLQYTFYHGDLISPKGVTVDRGVYTLQKGWVCETR